MAESVNVPAVGKVDRKWVIVGLGSVAGIVVYAYWRRAQAPDEEPATEGDEYVSGDEWSPDAYIGATQPGGATYIPEETDTDVNTNAEWAQRVVDLLEGVGYDRNKAAATVGKYLAGQPLDATEKLIIQAALGLLGNPPGGSLPIISAPGVFTQPGPTTPSTKLAKPTLRMSIGNPRNTYYQLDSSKVPGAAYYIFKRELGPGSPVSAAQIGTSRRVGPLKRNYTYQYRVRAHSVTPGKSSSDWSNPVRWKVAAK